ncbi:23S rRNA (2-N-methyl-G2445)-methyltransferase, putative [Syntrophotalea carbinolica DSM 2380]|uniref:Ribosomal RNA large subunit methyltransferase K/L n=1 Tax=Syntrophotalea carbinolica (strain DSM 2380 / NBRC 103641 / GraBd1) TaxID=338963 RepID=RLMKL_SYNC1|nr:bifunctional 23S rRNA (guanine(2069)-N(7))-methyltransferase RlmK/23S rRNA (guanine(2445)-N(2))-methyltransferase RlmL [Syntrophotalea carbinolica]Q3A2U5.1 RecName: Full=Ribosomal RNA large subunit methyltransferase K/L; Includes: RecName: Full=23S rRNA m2G2445 methyltransferase; AltName: Full=rRNA (guanine-N(2)-)-methyltransferase RlmL; Includes: RecName: Full=23S rRNA m7G2069 methyltransferase; AltName: Full=rRNA (guanine-N(7)-)-methyltransferase RlmK [Syntrophotalea carbinolica DSM 2380]ABA
MDAPIKFFATAPKGVEPLLADELRALGALEVSETRAGASFQGSLETAYRICLWSRLASRVLMPIAEFSAEDPDQLYAAVGAVPWEEHMTAAGTLAVDAQLRRSKINHSRFAALRVKDAVVDRFRERFDQRPSIDLERPDIRLNLHIDRDQATLSLDLSGDSLHRRGYRAEGVLAPLKENLAAAILLRAGWPDVGARGGALVDPMCGSGTLVIEAALITADCAPGLTRPYWGFAGWLQHRAEVWDTLLEEARQRREAGLQQLPCMIGYDRDRKAIRAARENARLAGLDAHLRFERCELEDLQAVPDAGESGGLLVTNPPYGERLGEVDELRSLYASLGEKLRTHFSGWQAAVFTGNPELAKHIGIRAHKLYKLYNGALECRLLNFDIAEQRFFGADAPQAPLSEGAIMFANRLRKNIKQLRRWLKKEDVTCYRLYDADMPEYAVAVDIYEDRVHVQEYQAPASVDSRQAERRLREVMRVLPEVLQVEPEAITLKVRRKQKGSSQYQKLDRSGERFEVREGNCWFLVNLTDYLDTGLFLDHRPTRFMLQAMAEGKSFLNLFAYTGTATVHAVKGGAATTVTVDMSRTYLDWAQANLRLNQLSGPQHRFVCADVLQYLEREQAHYDLIFLDPPTFSTSKSMETTLDIQRDHVDIIRLAANLLTPGGVLIFSNNFRKFRMDFESLPELEIENITAATIPHDFARNPKIHNCWRITRR